MKQLRCDVAIAGAGVIGSAIARELAGRGLRVLVFDREMPGRAASWAAAVMLSPLGETAGRTGPFLELADWSLSQFAPLADALQSQTGIDIQYRTTGTLHVSVGDADADLDLLAGAPVSTRFDVRAVDADAARAMEPLLTEDVTRAVFIGRDHRVNNRLLAQALVASATAAGATFRSGRPVASIIERDGRVTGVKLASGESVLAEHVVLAAGAWTGDIAGQRHRVPVRPIRGQMFAVNARNATAREPVLEHVLLTHGCYIVPRDDGRLLVGATVEDVGFRDGPTPRGLSGLMQSATRVLPVLADLPVVETWAGFRPGTPDGLPVIGADPLVQGLYYATGHFRNGILLAPATAACIADLVTGVTPAISLDPFSVMRFHDN